MPIIPKSPIRVSVDASGLADPLRTGIGRYLENLLPRLIDCAGSSVIFHCYAGRPFCSNMIEQLRREKKIEVRESNLGSLILCQQLGMGAWAERDQIDLHLATDGNLPLFLRTPAISVFQDLIWRNTLGAPFSTRVANTFRHHSSFRQASAIIVPSDFTRQDLLSENGDYSEKVHVIPDGVDLQKFFEANDTARIELADRLAALGLKPGYLLMLGNLMPHKNLITVIEALEQLSIEGMDLPNVVIVGGGHSSYLRRRIRFSPVECKTAFLGYIEDINVPLLYHGARALIFPSLYEGFGLPILEAMACGCPVIHAQTSSLPEVAGDAGLSFDGRDVRTLVAKLRDFLSDPGLSRIMIERGRQRAKMFSWERTAAQTWDVMRTVLRIDSSPSPIAKVDGMSN